jgi:thioredoxin-dependent peroxiredoxin
VSLDDAASHRAFAEKNGINFPLLPDPEGRLAALYGVDTSRGFAKRTTFVIGPDGKIFRTFAQVKVDGHEDEVLTAVKNSLGMN